MFIYSLYLHTSKPTFLVLLPTAQFAANACWRFCSSASWQRCIYCMTAAVCAWQLLYVHFIWFVYSTTILYEHDRWYLCMADGMYMYHVSCTCICCMYMTAAGCAWMMLYMHDIWYMCGRMYMAAAICALQMMSVWPLHTCAWQRLSFHGCSCLYMTKAVLSVAWV